MKFEKGHWNLEELEIQEWLEPKTKGFMSFDVATAVDKLKEEIASKEYELDTKELHWEDVCDLIDKIFGDINGK